MERTLFISDIHGQLQPLKNLLDQVNYSVVRDTLVLLGDYVGDCVGNSAQNLECLRYIEDLSTQRRVVTLVGNHDLDLLRYMQKSVRTNNATPYPYIPGLTAEIERNHPELRNFLEDLQLWYSSPSIIAVHAGVNPLVSDWRQSSIADFTSIRQPFLSARLKLAQTVVFGHTPCSDLHASSDIWYGPGRIGIDGGAGKGKQLNCLVCNNGVFSSASVTV